MTHRRIGPEGQRVIRAPRGRALQCRS